MESESGGEAPGSAADPRDEIQTTQQGQQGRQAAADTTGPSHEDAKVALGSLAALLSSAQTNGMQHPALTSSQPALAMFLSPTGDGTRGDCGASDGESQGQSSSGTLSVPSLSIRHGGTAKALEELSLQDSAALHLAAPLSADRGTVGTIPATVRDNVGNSLLLLVESRIRSSLALLVRQTVKLGSVSEAMTLTRLLTRRKPVALTTVVTSFSVLPAVNNNNGDAGDGSASFQREENGSLSVTLPLTFEAVVDANILGEMTTVTVTAPGTIRGTFRHDPTTTDDAGGCLLSSVEVALDTVVLLSSIVRGARDVGKMALRRAAQVAAAEKVRENETKREMERQQREAAQQAAQAFESIQRAAAAAAAEAHQRRQQEQQQQLNLLHAVASFGSLGDAVNQLKQQQQQQQQLQRQQQAAVLASEVPEPPQRQQSAEEARVARTLLESTSGLPGHLLETMNELRSERERQKGEEGDARRRRRKKKRGKKKRKSRGGVRRQHQQGEVDDNGERALEDASGQEEGTDCDDDVSEDEEEEQEKAQPMMLSFVLAQHEQLRREEEEKKRQTAAAALVSNDMGRAHQPPPSECGGTVGRGEGVPSTDDDQGQQQRQPLFAWLQGSDILLKNDSQGAGNNAREQGQAVAAENTAPSSQQQQQQQQQEPQVAAAAASVGRNESRDSLLSAGANALGVPQAYAGGNLPYNLSNLSGGSSSLQGGATTRLPSKKRRKVGDSSLGTRKVSFNMENETFECVERV